MKSKQYIIDGITIYVTKRSTNRRIRLSIAGNGQVKISMPHWLPYNVALEFAKSKIDWIKQKSPAPVILEPNRKVGKNHRLLFKTTDKSSITTRLNELEAIVYIPKDISINNPLVQDAAKRVIKKALLSQAKTLLPIRLRQLAIQCGYSYNEVKIKSLKTRWGSCDSHQNITLNLYLMELPWELIDYVLLHELNHTKIMQHNPKFWNTLTTNLPDCLELKKQLRSYPTLA
jgi:hypothetical protein